MSRKTNRKGGQLKNRNSVKHGAYALVDGRTSVGKLRLHIEATLATALGDPTPQEILVIKRASVKAIRCALIEKEILTCNGDLPDSLSALYLAWSHSLLQDLKALGLSRRAKPVQDLQDYMRGKYDT